MKKTEWHCSFIPALIGHEGSVQFDEDGNVKPLSSVGVSGGAKCVHPEHDCENCKHGNLFEYEVFPDAWDSGPIELYGCVEEYVET